MSYKHIKTLKNLTEKEVIELSRNDTKHYFRLKIYDRDQDCKGCNKKINNVTEASLDHILPRSMGGRTREVNLQLMHRRCNGKKSNNINLGISIDPKMLQPMRKNTPKTTVWSS